MEGGVSCIRVPQFEIFPLLTGLSKHEFLVVYMCVCGGGGRDCQV